MPGIPVERIKQIKSFPSLVKFLRDDLDWPLESEEIEELTFEYEPDELGIDPEIAVKIKEIKQLRPLAANQPWGIFYIGFEPKRLPVVVLRRVLQKLVIKKRQSAKNAHRNAWELHDLLFISSYGEENQRAITFAHFSEDEESKLPTLRVIGWDSQDTPLHMDRCINELEKLTFDEELSPDDWRQEWSKAFTLRHREVISTSKSLAVELAALATRIRQRVNKVIAVESEKGPIRQLYKAFQETLVHDLSEDDFADMYAQTITYGLFSTKKSRPAGLVAENLLDMIPKTNPFLKELLSTFLTVGGRKGKIDFDELGIDDVVQTLRNTDMDAVLRDFEDRNPLEDPVIHFYEGFLKEYDAKKKVKRGVFYTPRPVVSFIVRSVDEILRKDFGLEYGLADTTTWGKMSMRNKDIKIPNGVSEHEPFVQILDPATGTGTFLVEVIDVIYKTMTKKWESQDHMPLEFDKLWNKYVPKHLLPRLYGFELMMAPYAIAHMKIGLKLFETGYRFGSDERARIYLTNTLEEPKDISEYFEQYAPALAHEAKAANKIKKEVPTTVIIGNPPYAVNSSNKILWIEDSIRNRYYPHDDMRESNPKLLLDDYVKFILYSQLQIVSAGIGVLSYVTNHGYLDNPTFRRMRHFLLQSYSTIYILNLHGNSSKKEKCPDGSKDENVFDIKQGVSIGIFTKKVTSISNVKTVYADLWGLRRSKYANLLGTNVKFANGQILTPDEPFYFFVPQNIDLRSEYHEGHRINELMPLNSMGVKTNRDRFLIDYELDILVDRISRFSRDDISDSDVSSNFNLEDGPYWNNARERKKIKETDWNKNITKCLYRPFDIRFLLYQQNLIEIGRGGAATKVMRHIVAVKNLGLVTVRQVAEGIFNHVLATEHLVESRITISNKGAGYLFPLYLYPESDTFRQGERRLTNLNTRLIETLSANLKLQWLEDGQGNLRTTLGPEDVLNYIYGQLHSQEYRDRYAEFLKTDFPRVFLTKNLVLFRSLCQLGNYMISLHLMQSDTLNNHVTTFPVSGDNAVTKVGEKKKQLADIQDGKGKLYINKTQYFYNLPEEVWNFHIGGYQVCYKWLADRKKAGRKLSAEDIDHYHKIVVALSETIKIMKQIDETIDAHGGWPIK